MSKKREYIPPKVNIESLEADANFAMVCANAVGHMTVGCLAEAAPNEFEELVDAWGLDVGMSLNGSEVRGVIYSNDRTCGSSCYQGPYDTIFTS